MSKLVDKERLAKLAQALDKRAKDAVAAEATRADAAEKAIDAKADANAQAIAAINNEETGILAQAKAHADSKDATIAAKVDFNVYDGKIKEIAQKDEEQDQSIQGLDAAVKQIQTQIGKGDLTGVDKKIDDAVAELEAADTTLGNRIAVFEANGEKDVAALMNRATALEEKVGHDVKGEEPATGLFLEVDQAMAKANEVDQAVATEKERAEEQERLIREEMATEAARVNKKIADDIAAESASRVAEEERIAGLVSAEAQRADGVEKALQGEIDAAEGRLDALEAKFTGDESVDARIDEVAQAVADEKSRAEEKEGELNEAIEAEASRAASKEAELDAAIKAEASRADAAEKANAQAIADMKNVSKEGSLAKQIADEKSRAEGVEQGLEARIVVNEGKLEGLEKTTVKAEIEAAQAAAEKHADDAITALVDSAPDAMNTLNELAEAIKAHGTEYEAYVATVSQNIADAKQAAIDAAASAAASKDAALKSELQAEIDTDVKAEADRAKGEEQRIEAAYKAADTALHTTISAEIDADVKAEADRAKGVEQGLQAAIDVLNGADDEKGSVAKAVKDAVDAENQRAVARENAIETAYKAADQGLAQRLSDVENLVGIGGDGQQNALQVLQGEIDAVEEEVADLKEKDQELASAIALKVAQSDYDVKVKALYDKDVEIAAAAKKAQDDVDAVKGRMDTAESEIDALQEFAQKHDHSAMEQGIDANEAAIAKLNGAADAEGSVAKSIADALKDYTDTEAMMAILGNVVNSLAISMENDKLMLKLGGVDGVTIHETSLDMATDADIQAIIDGLDA